MKETNKINQSSYPHLAANGKETTENDLLYKSSLKLLKEGSNMDWPEFRETILTSMKAHNLMIYEINTEKYNIIYSSLSITNYKCELVNKIKELAQINQHQFCTTAKINNSNTPSGASFIIYPIVYREELTGAVVIERNSDHHHWTVQEKLFGGLVSQIIGFRTGLSRSENPFFFKSERIKETYKSQAHKSTEELIAEYNFINDHELRGPLCRISGLLQLLSIEKGEAEKQKIIDLLTNTANELDLATRKLSLILNQENQTEHYKNTNNI